MPERDSATVAEPLVRSTVVAASAEVQQAPRATVANDLVGAGLAVRGQRHLKGTSRPWIVGCAILTLATLTTIIILAINGGPFSPDKTSPSYADGYTNGQFYAKAFMALGGAGLTTITDGAIRNECATTKTTAAASGWDTSQPRNFLAGCRQAIIDGVGASYRPG